MDIPFVSVVIPVYERTFHLRDALESVFMQDIPAKPEIIVADDASSGRVYESLKPYFKRIKYIRLEKNSGVSAARNAGIKNASGAYVAFLDSDDIFLPSKLRLQIENLMLQGLAVSHTNEFWYRKDRFVNQGIRHSRYAGNIFTKILDICRVSPSSLLVKKSVFNKVGFFDEGLRVCEDYEWCLRCSLEFPFDYLTKKVLIKRAVTDNSLSSSIKYIESIRLDILKKFYVKYASRLDGEKRRAVLKELERKEKIVGGFSN